MFEEFLQTVRHALGIDLDPKSLAFWQISLRGLIIYLAALILLRVSEVRFLGRNTIFDIILGFMIGSLLSRAINGSAALGGTIIAVAVLVGLHWLLSFLMSYSRNLGKAIKGHAECLVRDGEILWDRLHRTGVSHDDLLEALRLKAHLSDPQEAKLVYLERNGEISVIPRRPISQVREVSVQGGVQTVRIEVS